MDKSSRIRIVALDEEGIVRDGLRALLDLDPRLEVLGAFADMAAVEQSTLRGRPDLVTVDLGTFQRHSRETLARIRRHWPGARVLVVASCGDPHVVKAVLGEGVEGYLLKSESSTDLSAAIRAVAKGDHYVSRGALIPEATARAKQPAGGQTASDGLSAREREVLQWIARGYRTREIAQQLSLSHKTIEKHRSSLMRKLRLRTATAVAAYAITNGYVG